MMRTLKIGGGILVLLVLLLAGGAYLVLSNLGSIIVTAVEEYGSQVTSTKVSLAEADIDITSGEGALSGLSVGNPTGFKTAQAMSLGQIAVKLDTDSIGSDTLVIREILIENPEITYELGERGSNIDTIKKNVEDFMAAHAGGGSEEGTGGTAAQNNREASGDEQKLIIETFLVRGGKVNVSATFLEGKDLSAGLPEIRLKDIGKESGGASPEQVAQLVIAAIGDATGKAVSGLNLGALQQGLEGVTDILQEGAGSASEAVGGAAGDALKQGAKEAGDKLKNLLGD